MTIKIKPNLVRNDKTDDTQTIGGVEQLYKSFVKPIDERIRSFQDSPTSGDSVVQNQRNYNTEEEKVATEYVMGGRISTSGYNESRMHAFLRNVGFPVVAPNGSFYNPGHDPNQKNSLYKRQNVNNNLRFQGNSILKLLQKREDNFKKRQEIFNRQDDVSIVYALLMRKTRPFLSAKTGQNPLYPDEQTTPLNNRKQEINDFNLDVVIPDIVTNVPHILKPFIVNPFLESKVEPEQTRRVAVPFLGSTDELVTGKDERGNKTKAIRPLLEQVIMNRLQVNETDTTFIKSAQNILQKKSASDSTSDIKAALLALSGQDSLASVNDEIIDAIQDFTTLESRIILTLVKAIKASIGELLAALRDIEAIRAKISLQPIPDKSGPEYPEGGRIRTVGGIVDPSELQQKQAILELQQLVNERLQEKFDDRIGENSYVSGISVDLTKDLTADIKRLKKIEDELGRQALNLLATIEKITGEISGIGIIDILAVYTALYTIDMRYLIGFLDDEALVRLKTNFNELVNDEVNDQLINTRPTIIECLTEFEKIFFNILAFADSLVVTSTQTPIRVRKGSIK